MGLLSTVRNLLLLIRSHQFSIVDPEQPTFHFLTLVSSPTTIKTLFSKNNYDLTPKKILSFYFVDLSYLSFIFFHKTFDTTGLTKEHIPLEDDFSNFRKRYGGEKYREILEVLVDIAYSLGFLSGPLIASTDGTLSPSFSCFRGYDYFEKECQRIEITGLLPRIKRRAGRLLNHPEKIVLGKEYQMRARCPSHLIPEKKKRPLINLFTFSFSRFDPNKEQDATSRLLGIEKRLKELGLMLLPLKSSINLIQMSSSLDICLIKCPHLPSDIEARRGVRRSKEDPSKLEYIFGYENIKYFPSCQMTEASHNLPSTGL